VVVSGPIASGKSSLARALAIRLEESCGVGVAVVDLDLVYEMLDPAGRPKDDGRLGRWRDGSRAAWRPRS